MSTWARVFGVDSSLLGKISPEEIEDVLMSCGYTLDPDYPCGEWSLAYVLNGRHICVLQEMDFDDYASRVSEALLDLADNHPSDVRRLVWLHTDTEEGK